MVEQDVGLFPNQPSVIQIKQSAGTSLKSLGKFEKLGVLLLCSLIWEWRGSVEVLVVFVWLFSLSLYGNIIVESWYLNE